MTDTATYQLDHEVIAVETAIRTIADEADELNVVDEATNTVALDMLWRVRKAGKRIDALKTRWLDPLNAQIKLIRSDFDAMAAPARKADVILARKTSEYRLALAEAVAAEQRRLEEETKKAIELADLYRALGETPAPVPVVLVAPPPKSVTTNAGSKITYRSTVHFEVENESLIPAEFWFIDQSKLGVAIRAGQTIPGVRVWKTEEPVVR
jgi:hypothetical protein